MRVVVVGCGYVGLVSAVGLAAAGHRVTGVELDAGRRNAVAAGEPPFHEPGLQELLQEVLASDRFDISAGTAAVGEADVVLLAVQTPPGDDGAIDLGPLRGAAAAVAAELRQAPRRRRVVAVRSTVVPGTAESLAGLFDADTAVASNPEFLQEGSAVRDFLSPDRVVVGCREGWGRELLEELYRPLGAPVVVTTPATAELAKYASNAFLATLISFSNEIAAISEASSGVDVEDVLGILHLDRRLSPRVNGDVVRPPILSYLKAGCGYGGSCLPKDISALVASRRAVGEEHPLLDAVRMVNEEQPRRIVARLEAELGGLDGRKVGVLGLAFKGGTDDVRSSPGLRIVDELLGRSVEVHAWDPLVREPALAAYAGRGVRFAAGLEALLAEVDACVITTNAPEFERVPVLMDEDGPVLVDGRRILPPEQLGPRRLGVGRNADQPGTRSGAAKSV